MPPPAAGDGTDSDAPRPVDDALSLAEEAEAEAAEAEALATAARARARALRLRREAAAAAAPADVEPAETVADVDVDADVTDTATPDAPTAGTLTDAADTDTADTEADPGTEFESAATDAPEARRSRFSARRVTLRAVVGVVAIVLTVGLIGASGFMLWHHQKVVAEEEQSAEFAAAARQGVKTLMSLDFSKAKDDVQRILDNTTGDFREEFAGQADTFAQVAEQSKVVTEATVNLVAVRSMTPDTANVLIAVTTKVSNAAAEQQPPRSWRLSVDVARDGDQIKMAKVEFVP